MTGWHLRLESFGNQVTEESCLVNQECSKKEMVWLVISFRASD
jgi:hypothetical protein